MNTNKTAGPTEKPTVEYVFVGDELNILDEIYNEIFEQVEKEIKHTI